MNVTMEEFLKSVRADDYYLINVSKDGKKVYFGYSHELPSDLQQEKVKTVYVDWASECLGIKLKE